MFDRDALRSSPERWTGRSSFGVVAAAHYRATQAGLEVLAEGGNAFDAAVATSLALSVVESAGSGIGGMAMLTGHFAGESFAVAGPCRAPQSVTIEAVLASRRYSSHRAVAVPSYPAVLDVVLGRYCTLPRQRLFEPAIALAKEGFALTALQVALIERYRPQLRKHNGGALFLRPDGKTPAVGTTLCQPELAATLARLAEVGLGDFYRGEIAAMLAADVADHGGFLTLEDLRASPQPVPSRTIASRFFGDEVHTIDRPAGGATLLHMLRLFERLSPRDFDPETPEGIELLARIIQRGRIDRIASQRGHLAAPLGSDASIHDAAAKLAPVEPELGEGETSHISVIDRHGNAVALTQSIERSFGAKVFTPGLGFLLNGYLKTYNLDRPSHPYYLRPGAVARSNAAPTLVLSQGRPTAVLGSTGSERMVSSIFGVLVRLRSQDPFTAVHAPRLHVTPRGQVLLEAPRFSEPCLTRLQRRGFTLLPLDAYSFKVGGLQLVAHRDLEIVGVADPRRDGAAAGP